MIRKTINRNESLTESVILIFSINSILHRCSKIALSVLFYESVIAQLITQFEVYLYSIFCHSFSYSLQLEITRKKNRPTNYPRENKLNPRKPTRKSFRPMKNPQRHGDTHRRKLYNCINQLYERALRLLYKDKNATYDELLQKDNSISVHYRNL